MLDRLGFHSITQQTCYKILEFTGFNNFFYLNCFLLNDMITKIEACIIEHQSNIEMFI
jgi:hypothetical protein